MAPDPGTVTSPPVATLLWQGAPPPALSTQISRSPTATDHTGCGHCFSQTKVTGQSHHFCLALPGTQWPDHRITEVHMPVATCKNPQRSGKFTKNSFLVPPAFCVGVLGGHRPDRTAFLTLPCALEPIDHGYYSATVQEGRLTFAP